MPESQDECRCLSCAAPQTQVPLVQLIYRAQQIHICPQCLPTLIHHPERLESKLAARDTKA